MQIVPLAAVPSQVVNILLNNQQCQISVAQRGGAMFLDLQVGGVPKLSGAICQNANPIVRDAYLGFIGDLEFLDIEGANDPTYDGLGGRYFLVYLLPSEVP